MELQWHKRSCPYIKTNFRQTQPQEQTQELRLSEEYPDIGRVLCAWGQPMIRSKEWRGEAMVATGGVSVSVAYLPEDGSGLRIMETWMPFQSRWNVPQNGHDSMIRIHSVLRGLDVRMLSARKMMLRANLAFWAEGMEPAEAEVFTPNQLPEDIEVLTNLYPAVIPKEFGEKQFATEEELHIPDAAQWISFSLKPELTEQNVVGNRAVVRGIGRLHYVYQDDAGDIKSGDSAIPFAQFFELEQDYDKGATVDTLLMLSSLEHEMTPDGVKIECGILAQYLVWNQQLLEMAEDAYSNHHALSIERESVTLPMKLDERAEVLNVMPQLPDGKLLDTSFDWDVPVTYRENDMLTIDLPITFRFLYMDQEGHLQATEQNTVATLDYPVAEGCQVLVGVQGVQAQERAAVVNMNLQTSVCQEFPMISGLTVGERKQMDQNAPAIIMRRMDTDCLWQLAKEAGSTMDDIRKANQLTQDPIRGQMLIIPIN